MRSILGKTVFSRILLINVIAVLVCIILLGSMQLILVTNYVSQRSEEMLAKNAESIVSLIRSNVGMESLENILRGFSRSSQSHIMVFDHRGSVLVNTSDSGYVKSTPAFLPDEYSKNVLDGKKNTVIGTMGGIFSETMFTLQLPIPAGNEIVGGVMISIPFPEQQRMNREFVRILTFSVAIVLLVSFFLSYMLAKLISMPIHSIRNSAQAFARGHLDARVGEEATQSGISEISELATTFNEMAFELEKVEEIRNSFISDVSHELRTPMTTISGFVYGILDDTIPQEKQKEYLQIVYDEVARLSRLVNNFLDISRMQSDRMELHKTNFDINEEIRRIIIGLAPRLEDRGIRLTLNFENEKCFVLADADSIKRVLTNLLDNAIKFTNRAGEITVTVQSKQQEVYVTVHNTGCGIPKDKQQMIFERLYKADQSPQYQSGGKRDWTLSGQKHPQNPWKEYQSG